MMSTTYVTAFGGQALVTCAGCKEWYNAEDRRPLVLTACRHKICEQCLADFGKCPTCRCLIKTKVALVVDTAVMKKAEASRPKDTTVQKKPPPQGPPAQSCPKCHDPKATFRMMCPHCNQLMCKACVMADIEVYLPQLERAFRRYHEILECMDSELEKHVEEEKARIDAYYAEKAKQIKNQLTTNVRAMDITRKVEKAANIIQELNAINSTMDTETPKIEDIEHAFEVIVDARRLQRSERTLNIGDNTIELDRFDESHKLSKFTKCVSLDSKLDQSNEDAFRELFASAPAGHKPPLALKTPSNFNMSKSMGSRLNLGVSTDHPSRRPNLGGSLRVRMHSPDSRLESSGQFSGFNKL